MKPFSLYANVFDSPLLKFSYALSTATSKSSWTGISNFGPYDKDLFLKSEIKAAIAYPSLYEKNIDRFIQCFINGLNTYPGFKKLFRIDIKFEKYPMNAVNLSMEAYDDFLKEVVRKEYDIVFVIIEGEIRNQSLYNLIKTILLGNGIPCQVIRSVTLNLANDQFQWVLSNLALSTYAKVGGTPWVIEAREQSEIVLGMSRTINKDKTAIVGFITIFKHNGDFILFYSKSPVTTWEAYQENLEKLVYEAIKEFEKKEELPSSLIFHFHKRTGKKEIEAVKNAIEKIGVDIKYALLHLNSYSNYKIFDTTDYTYIPLIGLNVRLSSRQAILVTDGRRQYAKRPYIGTPNMLEVTMDKESTIDFREFPRLLEQVYRFSYVNWRGFNAKTMPITIHYPYLIARLIGNLEDITKWNSIISNGRLMDKAWFL
ncbi:MAG: Piwi domain-containing protein [Candidatus Bathyarchaeia archaeon]